MRLKLCACLALVGALVSVTHTVAAPSVPAFLSVDINGYNADGGQALGPTQSGFQGFEAGQGALLPTPNWTSHGSTTGLTNIYATSEGSITANLKGVALNSTLLARNRGANAGATTDLLQDFAAAQNGGVGFGQNYVRLQLSGLTANKKYEITMYARESAFGNATTHVPTSPTGSWQAWSDIATIGFDGPGAWLDANVAAGATYQGIFTDADSDPNTPDVDTGYKNPIPNKGRAPISGADTFSAGDQYFHSLTFETTADAGGNVIVYGWSDANSYNGNDVQRASLLNGFQIGVAIPEPASLTMLGVGLVGFARLRRRGR